MARLQLQQQCRGAQTWLHLSWKIHGELIFARQAVVPARQAASLLQFAVKRHGNRNSAIPEAAFCLVQHTSRTLACS
jgi:hypothetical protein